MIEVITPDGKTRIDYYVSFEEMQRLVGGMVQCVTVREPDRSHKSKHKFVVVDAICNEEGLLLGLPRNQVATDRFKNLINMGPCAVGTWIVLSGKDRLK